MCMISNIYEIRCMGSREYGKGGSEERPCLEKCVIGHDRSSSLISQCKQNQELISNHVMELYTQ